MSGFVGLVNLDGSPVDRELLQGMTQYLAPRGPDAQRTWTRGHVGFGHALLRTTPESEAESQPFTLDGNTWIVADCRVDGREELVRALSGHGWGPADDAPDPELILRAYAVWGESCLDRLLGDFSFAIWDGSRRTLFCARDHFGVKPFFYAKCGSTLILSNTLNCLRLHPAMSEALDELAIADFLLYGYALDPDRSSFAAIRRLPAAHAIALRAAAFAVRRYWQLPLEDEIVYTRRGDYIEQFLELLEVATRDRLRATRVGIFMSGGLDSPTVAATAHRILVSAGSPFDFRAHTIVFDRIVPDEERRYSQLAADAIGIPVHHYPFDDYGFPPPEPEPDWYPPEPRIVFDRGRMIAVHRPAAEHARVLLRADGADPLIEVTATALQNRLRTREYRTLAGDFFWLVAARRQFPRLGIRTVVRGVFGQAQPPPAQPYPNWLAAALQRRLDLPGRWRTENEREDPRPGFELMHSYWPATFEALDPGSMQLAAEIRYPFLDLRLARYLLRLPGIPWGPEKSLLRVAMKGILPGKILRRRKAPVAGNPWARLVPPATTAWWVPYLAPAPELEQFVDVSSAKVTLARVLKNVQSKNAHADIDMLRSSLRPLSLNLWLRHTAHARFSSAANKLPAEVIP